MQMHLGRTQAAAGQSMLVSVSKAEMIASYQPWVILTYGDAAKTKTITLSKYARIVRTLRGEEVNSAENSKFRFWVRSKGFRLGAPEPDGRSRAPARRWPTALCLGILAVGFGLQKTVGNLIAGIIL